MRIFRISNLLSIMMATILGVLLFWTSQAVQQNEDKLSMIETSLNQEKDTVRVLSVEWEYLNAPQRLEKLASEELGMHASEASEVVHRVADIPVPVIVQDPSLFEGGFAQSVSFDPEPATVTISAPQKHVQKIADIKLELLTPQAVEKQNFDKLIDSLNDGVAAQ